MVASARERADLVRALVYEANLLLDASRYTEWLALLDEGFSYEVKAYSPEIRKDQLWLQHDRAGVENLIELLPRHNSDHSTLTRHTAVYRVAPADRAERVDAISAVAIYRTLLDGGATSLFAVGKYHDAVIVDDHGARFARRTLRLETCELGIGTHYPL